jgi:hypothetical protein
MAFPGEGTTESAAYLEKMHPDLTFYFWPSLVAFQLEHVFGLASALFTEIKLGNHKLLKLVMFDPMLVAFIAKSGESTFLRFLDALAQEQASLFMGMRRFPPMLDWPKELDSAIKQLKQEKRSTVS